MYREENFHPPTSRRTELTHLRVGRYAGRVGSEPHQIGREDALLSGYHSLLRFGALWPGRRGCGHGVR